MRFCLRTNLSETFMDKLFAVLAAIAVFGLAGCNTIEGAGKDVKAAGATVEKAADDAKPK